MEQELYQELDTETLLEGNLHYLELSLAQEHPTPKIQTMIPLWMKNVEEALQKLSLPKPNTYTLRWEAVQKLYQQKKKK